MNKKIKKIVLAILALITTVLIGVVAYAGDYLYDLALDPTTSKALIFGDEEEEPKENDDWIELHSDYKDINIESNDGLKLHAYEIINKKPSDKWAIVVHGYTGEGVDVSAKAKEFYDRGYNLIVPDLRGHGTSEGHYIAMGYDDRLDIISFIDYINKNHKDAQIVLHGTSMGAATVLSASGENLPENVAAIIADCGYTSAYEQFSYQLKELFGLPAFPFMNVSDLYAKSRAGYSIKDAAPVEFVKNSNTPILYIHGDKDDFVPYYMMEELYNETKSPAKMVTIEGAGHGDAHRVDPTTYWNSVDEFLKKYI